MSGPWTRLASLVATAVSGASAVYVSPLFFPVMAASAVAVAWSFRESPNINVRLGIQTTIGVLNSDPRTKPFADAYANSIRRELSEATCEIQKEIDFKELNPDVVIPRLESKGFQIMNQSYVENVSTYAAVIADLRAIKGVLITWASDDPVVKADLGVLIDVLLNMTEEELRRNCSGKYLKVYEKKADSYYVVLLCFANIDPRVLRYTRIAVNFLTEQDSQQEK